MTLPSLSLLSQSILSGVFIGGMYSLIGLGLGLSWGLLRQINLAHFGFVFLSAYLSYHMATVWGLDPLLTLVLLPPLFFAIGVAMQWLLSRFLISPFNSLLVTFGFTVMIESLIQYVWTADFRRLQSGYGEEKFVLGPLYIPVPELLTLVLAVLFAFAIWAAMRFTDLGKAMRAMAEDGPIAAAFGINQRALSLILSGTCVALASIAGICFALTFTLTPTQIFSWVGVVFAVVMLGGLGSALGPLVAGVIVGVSEAVAMAVFAPSWAPLVSFSLLILMLLFRPGKV
ncbi:MAG TPA: branched-chain amino acid ABC transporter permease [Ferrovibrio sp.]|jgi:branched-chain amino acid transport system permease protein|uniref:branched-chain amino acid ABC transporter permease n=1 Tax=Ferrovibrio sp. TaxID=1917215 RepID=UPI002B4B4722|nr:branched-chain amino acid ABC transporter permease [Ferrovibrio sp.]HLT75842.1 branched-chain amino acid ABC transporter permease [Ferrovibrio sp.]